MRSNVSLWLAPPSIHNRMHFLVARVWPGFWACAWAAREASTPIQPDIDAPGELMRSLKQVEEEGSVETEGWRLHKDGSRFLAFNVRSAMRDRNGEDPQPDLAAGSGGDDVAHLVVSSGPLVGRSREHLEIPEPAEQCRGRHVGS